MIPVTTVAMTVGPQLRGPWFDECLRQEYWTEAIAG
jgi:hypothetical protein